MLILKVEQLFHTCTLLSYFLIKKINNTAPCIICKSFTNTLSVFQRSSFLSATPVYSVIVTASADRDQLVALHYWIRPWLAGLLLCKCVTREIRA